MKGERVKEKEKEESEKAKKFEEKGSVHMISRLVKLLNSLGMVPSTLFFER